MKKQSISIVLLVTILLQSCVSYQKSSVSLEVAAYKGKVRVESTNGDIYKFRKIEMRDGIYYGTNNEAMIRLETSLIEGIYLKDIKKSKQNTVAIIVATVTVGVLVTVGYVIYFLVVLNNI